MTTETALFWTIIFVFSAWMESRHDRSAEQAKPGSGWRIFHLLASLLALFFMGIAVLHMGYWIATHTIS